MKKILPLIIVIISIFCFNANNRSSIAPSSSSELIISSLANQSNENKADNITNNDTVICSEPEYDDINTSVATSEPANVPKATATPKPTFTPAPTCSSCGSTEHTIHPQEIKQEVKPVATPTPLPTCATCGSIEHTTHPTPKPTCPTCGSTEHTTHPAEPAPTTTPNTMDNNYIISVPRENGSVTGDGGAAVCGKCGAPSMEECTCIAPCEVCGVKGHMAGYHTVCSSCGKRGHESFAHCTVCDVLGCSSDEHCPSCGSTTHTSHPTCPTCGSTEHTTHPELDKNAIISVPRENGNVAGNGGDSILGK